MNDSPSNDPRIPRPTVAAVTPKQSRPNMVLKAFRIRQEVSDKLDAWAEAHGMNSSEAMRHAIEQLLSEEGSEESD